MIKVYKQENYLQELGTGQGYTIARYGCALTCLAALSNWYGRDVTPDKLNLDLVNVEGFAENGTVNADGTKNKTLLRWGTLSQVFGEIILEKNISYPTIPADMNLIDAYLVHNQPVVVGVSFLHNAKDTVPSHYVLIYRKNADGTYQMADPWYGDDSVFDKRYAVNGMTPSQCILQVVAYSGPAPEVSPAPQPAQEVAHTQQAVTPTDIANSQADANYNLYMQEVGTNKTLNDRITELQQQNTNLQSANTKLITEIANTKALNSTLSSQLSDNESKDSAAIEETQKQIESLREKELIANSAAEALQSKTTLTEVLSNIESLLSIKDWANKFSGKTPPKPQSVLSALGIVEEVSK